MKNPECDDKSHAYEGGEIDDLPAALDYVRRALLTMGYNHCDTDAKIIQEAIDRLKSAPSAVAVMTRQEAVTLFCEIANRRLHEMESFNLTENVRSVIAEFAASVGTRSASAALTPLERFALDVLEEHRNELTDVDGGWIQDKAVELGLLAGVVVTDPCSAAYCKCAEYGDFPQECLRETDAIRAKMAEFRRSADSRSAHG